MNLLRSIDMAFCMFSAIPMPQIEWKQENMRYMLPALPLVGVVIGGALCLWNFLCALLGLGSFLFAAGVVVIPLLISGGVHLDGFCDTVDALSSHAEPPRKREILKDPSAGAFAVIFAGAYLLSLFGLDTELGRDWRTILAFGVLYVFSRSLGAFAGTAFPGSTNTGLLAQFRDAAAKKAAAVEIVWWVLCAAALIVLFPIRGVVAVVIGLLTLLGVRIMADREFGGMSGDLAGFLISLSELLMVAGFVLSGKVVMLWS